VFDEMPDRNIIAWSTMISGYAKLDMFNEALGLFGDMQKAGVVPDEVTMASVVSACAGLGALDVGRWVHTYIKKQRIVIDIKLNTALINMYAKCGCIEKAKEVFDEMPTKDSRAWSSMIIGFAIHGHADDALSVFADMENSKVFYIPHSIPFHSFVSPFHLANLAFSGETQRGSIPRCITSMCPWSTSLRGTKTLG